MFRWSPWLLISLLATSCILDPKGEDPSEFSNLNDVAGSATADDVGPTPPPEATQTFPGGDDAPVSEDDLAATDEETARDTEAEPTEEQGEADAGELDAGVLEVRDSAASEPGSDHADADADSSSRDATATGSDGGSAAAGDASDGGTP